jgi:hypothetical protein
MYRTSAERRHNDWTKAIRKMKICEEINHGYGFYNNLHQYSKNKIHCSCPMCSAKTRGNFLWGSSNRHNGKNYSIKDLKRYEEMIYELEELNKSA